ncbi:alanine racemase [Pseudozobellia thermophila]|uniref:Alanine racemase n=1 Tax=Pseudozobellia thermophila TaxID=192903 RepID=A0A1M6B2X7_9FLAO|nr:alanine racemase [Pseudozobellia thermophila]SHI42813.1 alanine racemase [Pseudozobellia thermophila]
MSKAKETVLEIDLGALAHNYAYLKAKLKPDTKFMGVVKAFAYGSDSVAIAKKLQDLGVDYLAVAYVKEGVVLRKAGITVPILVLHPLPASFKKLIKHDLEPSIYSEKILLDFLRAAEEQGLGNYPVHLKFNTGLNRLGFREDEVEHVCNLVKGRKEIRVESVFSHLAASEDLNEAFFTKSQIAAYERITGMLDKGLGSKPLRHLLNTSGIINYPMAQYDMVRSGIGLYGYGNEAAIDKELRPVARLKTIISQINRIPAGETVGYNRKFTSQGPIVSATLPVGHADGIGRPYGKGKGYVVINEKRAYILGNVCMDMIMVDVTDIDCKAGDEVIVFGGESSAETLANHAGTISYELLTGISQRVKRVVLDE